MRAFDADGAEVALPGDIARIHVVPSGAEVQRGRRGAEEIQVLAFLDVEGQEVHVAMPRRGAEDMGEEMCRTKIRAVRA